jgi:chemotaxis protein MotB
MASSVPLEPNDPLSPSNRRITILVMTKEAEERLLGATNIPVEVETAAPQPVAAPKAAP